MSTNHVPAQIERLHVLLPLSYFFSTYSKTVILARVSTCTVHTKLEHAPFVKMEQNLESRCVLLSIRPIQVPYHGVGS